MRSKIGAEWILQWLTCHITDRGELKDNSVVTGVNPVAFPVLEVLGSEAHRQRRSYNGRRGDHKPKSVAEWFDSGTSQSQNMVGQSLGRGCIQGPRPCVAWDGWPGFAVTSIESVRF